MSTWVEARADEVPLVRGAIEPAVISDPFRWYRELRLSAPLAYSEDLDAYVVTRYDDVKAALGDDSAYSSVLFEDALLPNIFNSDGVDHERYRAAVLRHFNRGDMRALDPRIRDHAAHLAHDVMIKIDSGEPVDLVEEFSQLLPISIVCDLLGIPEDDGPLVAKWARAIVDVVSTGLGYESAQRVQASSDLTEMGLYFSGLIEKRASAPGSDLISALVTDDHNGGLDHFELLLLLATLMLTGHVTTVSMLSSGFFLGLEHPDVWTAARQSRRWHEYIEEVLRFEAPLQVTVRKTRQQISLYNVDIPAGSMFYAYMGSANRDPDVFIDADSFTPGRRVRPHLSFGGGPHFCLAAALARQEGQAAFDAMAPYLSGLRIRPGGAAFTDKPGARSLDRLVVTRARQTGYSSASGWPRGGALARVSRAAKVSAAIARPTTQARAKSAASQAAELRGVALKVGQLISFLEFPGADSYRQAFAAVRDNAQAVDFDIISQVVDSEIGLDAFDYLDKRPAAAASIGQVHRARTRSGVEVAVKVQYPGISEAIAADLSNAAMMSRFVRTSMRLVGVTVPESDVDAVMTEVRDRVLEELDYRQEASNQREFQLAYRGHPAIRIPDVVDELSTSHVLTTRWADGVRWENALDASLELRTEWAQAVFDFVFEGLYLHGVFNADPHPGNYLFSEDGSVSFLDFGCVKKFGGSTVGALRECTLAVLDGDMPGAHAALLRLGVLNDLDIDTQPIDDWLAVLYRPLTTRPFEYDAAFSKELAAQYAAIARRSDLGLGLHRDVVMLNRINLGVHNILSGLGATADWRARFNELLGLVGK